MGAVCGSRRSWAAWSLELGEKILDLTGMAKANDFLVIAPQAALRRRPTDGTEVVRAGRYEGSGGSVIAPDPEEEIKNAA